MDIRLFSGQAAIVLESTEPALNHLVRKRRIEPLPPVVGGRRQWSEEHILAAARLLNIPESLVRARLAEVARG